MAFCVVGVAGEGGEEGGGVGKGVVCKDGFGATASSIDSSSARAVVLEGDAREERLEVGTLHLAHRRLEVLVGDVRVHLRVGGRGDERRAERVL